MLSAGFVVTVSASADLHHADAVSHEHKDHFELEPTEYPNLPGHRHMTPTVHHADEVRLERLDNEIEVLRRLASAACETQGQVVTASVVLGTFERGFFPLNHEFHPDTPLLRVTSTGQHTQRACEPVTWESSALSTFCQYCKVVLTSLTTQYTPAYKWYNLNTL